MPTRNATVDHTVTFTAGEVAELLRDHAGAGPGIAYVSVRRLPYNTDPVDLSTYNDIEFVVRLTRRPTFSVSRRRRRGASGDSYDDASGFDRALGDIMDDPADDHD